MHKINNLQSLRGICAVMILAHHFGFSDRYTRAFGDCAVSIFLVLSGFVLTLAYHQGMTEGKRIPLGKFMGKRIATIYPLYIVTMLIMLALRDFRIGPKVLVADVLMLQSWVPNEDFYFSLNAVGWFVSDIMFFYLLFLPALRVLVFAGRRFFWSFIPLLTIYFTVVFTLSGSISTSVIYVFPPMQFVTFLLGMALCACYLKWRGRLTVKGPMADLLTAAVFALEFGLIYAYITVDERLTLASYWWLPSCLLVFVLAITDGACSLTTKILHLPIFVTLGNVSYSFFLLHLPYLYISRNLLKSRGIGIPLQVEFIIAIIVLFLLSILVNKYFEKPMAKWLSFNGRSR